MFVARWDLDKTYLRTEFDTLGALVRTALERPDHKRTVPGAAELMRQLGAAGAAIHILSGSPEQLRGRIVQKLRLDAVEFASLTLKPNLQNLLRLRFRSLRGQMGYKLPALLRRRCELEQQREPSGELCREVLLGDDAEADALVYSLYADVCERLVDDSTLVAILRAADAYPDDIADTLRFASYVERGPVVERILIHLDRQSSPSRFDGYGSRVVPFYNYLQAAFVLHEDGRLPAAGVLAVARDLVLHHHFAADALQRCYADLQRRGHACDRACDTLPQAWVTELAASPLHRVAELHDLVRWLESAHQSERPARQLRPSSLHYEALVRAEQKRPRRRG